MLKTTLHIIVIAVLALNLTVVPAFSCASDCGMECCRFAVRAGASSFEAPTCCNMDGATCGFKTGNFREMSDEALCCPRIAHPESDGSHILSTADPFYSPAHECNLAHGVFCPGSSQAIPVYLTNAAILC